MTERLMLSDSEDGAANSAVQTERADNEVQDRVNEQMSVETISQENIREIADKVYHLMQRDLILERERATRIGG